jgi:quercetin dioxygenase-like cupin family protein
MNTGDVLWVLGHRIRPFATDPAYGMIEVTSPPRVPGPPPHFHKNENEFFLIVQGTLDVLIDGEWRRRAAGSLLDLPPNTTHSFVNNTGDDVVWVTGWRPKGFERFFADFGIPAGEPRAQERSTADEVVQKVVRGVEAYGMYLAR